MKTFIAALIISIIVFLSPPQQASTGCVVSAGVDIPADLATAQAGSRCLELPAGVFTVQPGVLLGTADSLRIFGQGIGRTILQLPDDLVVSAPTYALRLTGAQQRVSDLTIRGGTNASGAASVAGISIYSPATGTRVQRVEVIGLYGGNTAGAAGIDLYQPWNVDNGVQATLVEDCYIHDGPNMTGVVVNSNGNTLRNNRIADVGNTFSRHGLYMQGGYNLIDGNTIERVGGYSLHAWQKVQSIDGSGNVYSHNLSIDPGFQHMIASGMLSNGTNPAIPNGKPLTRNVTISANLFRNTGGHQSAGINSDVPAIITGNTFEDVAQVGSENIKVLGAGSIVSGNRLSSSVRAGYAISVNAAATISENTIEGLYGTGITVNVPGVMLRGNRLTLAGIPSVQGANGIATNGQNVIVDGNIITMTGPSTCIATSGALPIFRGNILEPRGGSWTYTIGGVNVTAPLGSDVVR